MASKKRKLSVQKSHDEEPVELAVNARKQELKVIGELRGQRHYKERLHSFFTKPIDANLTYEFLLTAVGRSILGLACFHETGWLPACLLVESLHQKPGFCKSCNCGKRVEGREFLKYLDEHSQTLRPEEWEHTCCSHAEHVWMPVPVLLGAMKIEKTQFERFFLNTWQCFDETSYQLLRHLLLMRSRGATARQMNCVLYMYRCWFNDFNRFQAFVRIHEALEVADEDDWMDQPDLVSACVNESFMSFDTSVRDIRKALLLEAVAAGKQPKRGYNQGPQAAEKGTTRLASVAERAMKFLNGGTVEEILGADIFYVFIMQIDMFYFNRFAPLSSRVREWQIERPIKHVGPGCPEYLSAIAVGYGNVSSGSGMVNSMQVRQNFVPFLEQAAEALEKMPAYKFLIERELIPAIKAWNLQGTACEKRKKGLDFRAMLCDLRKTDKLSSKNIMRAKWWKALL